MTDGLYERARDDADLHRRLAAAYSGRDELMDALWWYAHPDLPAPSGRPSPLARVRELESRLYSRQARPEDAAETSRQLRHLREEVRADHDAIARAIAEAKNPPVEEPSADVPADSAQPNRLAGLPTTAAVSTSSLVDPSFTSPATAAHETDDDDGEELEPARSQVTGLRRMLGSRWALPTATAVAGLLLGSALTAAVLAGVGGASGTVFAGSSSAPGSGAASATPALAVFDEPRTPEDTPELLFSTTLVRESFHHLGTPAPLFAARDLAGDACLVLVQDDGGYTANCTEGEVFPSLGVAVSGVYKLPDPVVEGEGSSDDPSTVDATSSTDNDVFAEVDAVWLPDGQVQLERTLMVGGLGGPVDG